MTWLRSQQALICLGHSIPLPCPAHNPVCSWKCSLLTEDVTACASLVPGKSHHMQVGVGYKADKVLLSGSAWAGVFPWGCSLNCAP